MNYLDNQTLVDYNTLDSFYLHKKCLVCLHCPLAPLYQTSYVQRVFTTSRQAPARVRHIAMVMLARWRLWRALNDLELTRRTRACNRPLMEESHKWQKWGEVGMIYISPSFLHRGIERVFLTARKAETIHHPYRHVQHLKSEWNSLEICVLWWNMQIMYRKCYKDSFPHVFRVSNRQAAWTWLAQTDGKMKGNMRKEMAGKGILSRGTSRLMTSYPGAESSKNLLVYVTTDLDSLMKTSSSLSLHMASGP